jgi:PAS domain S-box-containing protein
MIDSVTSPPSDGHTGQSADSQLRRAADYARMKLDHLRSRTLGVMEVLYSLQSFHGLLAMSGQTLEVDLFRRFVKEPMARHRELQSLAWSAFLRHSQRASFETSIQKMQHDNSYAIRELDEDGQLRIAGTRETYVPLTFQAPLAENAIAQGFDLASESRRRLALERARDTGAPFTTTPLRLVQETHDQLGCLVVLPVYHGPVNSEEERREQLAGFVSAAFRIADMVDAFLDEETDPLFKVEVAVFDKSESGQQICRRGALLPEDAIDIATEWLEFAGARWRVRVPLDNQGVSPAPALPSADHAFRSLFENAVVGMFQSSPSGRYLAANTAMAHLYGYTSPDELMLAFSDIGTQLYVDPSRRSEFIQLLQQNDSIAGFESQVRRRDGSLIWISEKARCVRDAQGRLLYYEGTVEDITEQLHARDSLNRACLELQQRLEEHSNRLARTNAALSVEIEERKKAEKLAAAANDAKSVFLSHMSHEIRTPLNAVIGYTQILQRDQSLSADQQSILNSLASGSHHLMSLVEHLLDLSKIESGSMDLHPAAFDLQNMIQLLESMFRHRCQQKKLRLQVDAIAAPNMLIGDEAMLRQVLINLLSNAVKFTDTGHVSLRVARETLEHWRFEVADTGIGIEPELQEQIFEPFKQARAGRQRGGTGLGLAILKRQVELMGGTLNLESTPGRGSLFSFMLPLPCASQPASAPTPPLNLRVRADTRVSALVVDDVAANRDLLARMLRLTGCEVETVADAATAIDWVRLNRPQLVFMDIWMPEMNGIEATQQLLREFRKTPLKIVAHSATAFTHEASKYLETGFEDFFPKPFRFERLCACLQSLLPDHFAVCDPPSPNNTPPPLLEPLPASLAQRLRQAAEDYNITALKQCLEVLKVSGFPRSALTLELDQMIGSYDMRGIIKLVEHHLPLPAATATPLTR